MMAPMTNQARPAHDFPVTEDLTLTVMEPTKGQMYIILGMVSVVDDDDQKAQFEAVRNFGVVIDSLILHDQQRRKLNLLLAKGTMEIEDFFALAMEIIRYFAPDAAPEEAGTRAEKRAAPPAKRAPAKRAAPAKRR
jgi:hypothetical protein